MNLSTLIPYPLYTDIEDCYVPEWAAMFFQKSRVLTEEEFRVTITLHAEEVASELGRRVN